MNASNDKPKIVKFIVKQYKNVLVRLGISLVIIAFISLLLKLILLKNSPMPYVTFQNTWLACSYTITGLITGIMYFCVAFYPPNEKAKNIIMVYGWPASFIFGAIAAASFLMIHSSCTFFSICLPVICASIVLIVDCLLAKAGLERLKNVYLPFDLAVLVGVLLAAGLPPMFFKNKLPELIYGFRGGASAFQLIMANIVFDPSNYIEEEKEEHVKN